MPLRFDHPEYLLLGALAIPLIVIGWRALALADNLRRAVILVLRTLLLLALAVVLAGPRMIRAHDHLTVIGVLDISGSVQRFGGSDPRLRDPIALEENATRDHARPDQNIANADPSIIEHLRQWFRAATQEKTPDDRFGLIVFDGKAIAVSAPTKADYVDDNLDVPIAPGAGTNIEDAVRLALAMFPPDTGKRLILVTDGNETAGNVMEAVQRLAGGDVEVTDFSAAPANPMSVHPSPSHRRIARIPIDVLPIIYQVTHDVQVARVEAPPSAQAGQTITVRVVVESTAPTAGRLSLFREGEPVDLNGEQSGVSRRVNLPAGQSVHMIQVALGSTPVNRFEAVFEADDPSENILPDNDRAEAFTATPSKGSALIVDSRQRQRENALAQVLTAADIPASVRSPAQFPDDLLSLQNYDLIVLDNIAAFELSRHQQELLARYVADLGGGLIMSGGEKSFGAGGWKGSPVADLLPVEVDPPRELRTPPAALVLVLDKSGSMNQAVAGARASQQQVANEGAALAIESLRSDNLIGVVTFDMVAYTLVPLQRNEDPRKVADKVRGINADGGTNLHAALQRAYDMIKDTEVARKRVVFLTDGRSASNDGLEDMARRMAQDNIQLTTIAVGDDADYETLETLARVGGGEFYPVRDPRTLPRVLIDSVQVINKPLIKEISFQPIVLATGSTLTAGMSGAPPLDGLVITGVRNDPKVSLEMIDSDREPLLAHWQFGLGRVAAFTSESIGSGRWSQHWNNWPTAEIFWTQLARLIARPAMNLDGELITSIKDDRLTITYDMAADDDSLALLIAEGTVYQPDGSATAVRLRQTAPGRYEGSVEAAQQGNYIVALNPRRGSRQLAPSIGGANRSSNPEFRRYASNVALLEEIVQQTGGRQLDLANAQVAGLFDRRGMPPSTSSLPAWRTALWWVLALVLLDVAARRIAWDSLLLRRVVQRALERVAPSRVRGAQVATTLATLRKVSDDMEAIRTRESSGFTRFSPTGRTAPPPSRTEFGNVADDLNATTRATIPTSRETATAATQAAGPSETQVAAALDALLGRSKSPPPATDPSPAPPADVGTSATETTSNLLAAKRRARQRAEDQRSGKP